jgi:hypothetical protein
MHAFALWLRNHALHTTLMSALAAAVCAPTLAQSQHPEDTVGETTHTTETVTTTQSPPGTTEATRTTETVTTTEPPPPTVVHTYDPWLDHTMRPRIALRGILGGGGSARIDRVDGRSDLRASYGGAVELEVPVLPILSLGGELAILGWRSEMDQFDVRRNVLTSLAVVPRLRLPFEGVNAHGALYVAVPVGLSLNVMDDSYGGPVGAEDGSFRTGVGYNIGGRVGSQLFFSPRVGVTAELEYRYHAFWHSLDAPLTDDANVATRLHQLLLHLGVVFAL